jgi:hypothetical protein
VATPTKTPEMLAEEWLAAAYELVERGWCQGAAARDAAGDSVEPDSAAARSWSATGALTCVWRRSDVGDELGLGALQFANLALSAAANRVPKLWNDMPERRKQDVLDAFARAVSLVQDPALFGDGNGNAARRQAPNPAAD